MVNGMSILLCKSCSLCALIISVWLVVVDLKSALGRCDGKAAIMMLQSTNGTASVEQAPVSFRINLFCKDVGIQLIALFLL